MNSKSFVRSWAVASCVAVLAVTLPLSAQAATPKPNPTVAQAVVDVTGVFDATVTFDEVPQLSVTSGSTMPFMVSCQGWLTTGGVVVTATGCVNPNGRDAKAAAKATFDEQVDVSVRDNFVRDTVKGSLRVKNTHLTQIMVSGQGLGAQGYTATVLKQNKPSQAKFGLSLLKLQGLNKNTPSLKVSSRHIESGEFLDTYTIEGGQPAVRRGESLRDLTQDGTLLIDVTGKYKMGSPVVDNRGVVVGTNTDAYTKTVLRSEAYVDFLGPYKTLDKVAAPTPKPTAKSTVQPTPKSTPKPSPKPTPSAVPSTTSVKVSTAVPTSSSPTTTTASATSTVQATSPTLTATQATSTPTPSQPSEQQPVNTDRSRLIFALVGALLVLVTGFVLWLRMQRRN